MTMDVFEPAVAGMALTDLMGLIPLLVAAYAVITGAVGLATGWQLFTDHQPRRYRRGAVVPPVGAIEQDNEGIR